MLTVVAPEVRVAALEKESGFAVIVVLQGRGPGVSTGREFGAESAKGASRREGKAYQKLWVRVGIGQEWPKTELLTKTARDRGGRDGSASS